MQTSLLDAIEAAHRRDDGILRAVTHADAVVENWQEKAMDCFKIFLKTKKVGECFLMENFREYSINTLGLKEPPSMRSFGAIALRAKAMGLVQSNGLKSVNNVKAHKAWATQWEKL